MKWNNVNKLSIFLVLVVCSLSFKQFDFEEGKVNNEEEEDDDAPKEPDKELERIRSNIYEIAQNMQRKSSIKKKQIFIGELPDAYPVKMRNKAKLIRQNRDIWDDVMLYPTAIWRMCIYPNFKINYVVWCKQKFALSNSKIKLNGKVTNLLIYLKVV